MTKHEKRYLKMIGILAVCFAFVSVMYVVADEDKRTYNAEEVAEWIEENCELAKWHLDDDEGHRSLHHFICPIHHFDDDVVETLILNEVITDHEADREHYHDKSEP